MKIQFLFAIVVVALTTQTVVSATSARIQQSDISAEEYAVYDAVIDNMFAGNKVTFDFGGDVTVKLLVISNHTATDDHLYAGRFQDYRGAFSSIEAATVDDYAAKSKQSAALKSSFNLRLKYVLADARDLKDVGSENFSKRFPDSVGYVNLARVGFNRDHSQALAYMSHLCGGLCGHGFFLFLAKTRGEWKVETTFQSWIS
jgi:hypothetical protein